MIRVLAKITACAALIVAWTTADIAAAEARDADNVRRAAEFADHVEDGVDAAQAVNRTRKIANVATGGIGAAVVDKTVGEVVENQVEDLVQDEFREFIEDEVGDQVFDSVRGSTRGKVRKHIIR